MPVGVQNLPEVALFLTVLQINVPRGPKFAEISLFLAIVEIPIFSISGKIQDGSQNFQKFKFFRSYYIVVLNSLKFAQNRSISNSFMK